MRNQLLSFVLCLDPLGQEEEQPKVVKVTRPVSPVPSDPPAAAAIEAEIVVGNKVHDGVPREELDELDAAEAAQFKADVQGHRHHEVTPEPGAK